MNPKQLSEAVWRMVEAAQARGFMSGRAQALAETAKLVRAAGCVCDFMRWSELRGERHHTGCPVTLAAAIETLENANRV